MPAIVTTNHNSRSAEANEPIITEMFITFLKVEKEHLKPWHSATGKPVYFLLTRFLWNCEILSDGEEAWRNRWEEGWVMEGNESERGRRTAGYREKSNYLAVLWCYDSSCQEWRAAAYCAAFITAVHLPILLLFAFFPHNFSVKKATELLNSLSYLWLKPKQQILQDRMSVWEYMGACACLFYFIFFYLFVVCVCHFLQRLLCLSPVSAVTLSKHMHQCSLRAVHLLL